MTQSRPTRARVISVRRGCPTTANAPAGGAHRRHPHLADDRQCDRPSTDPETCRGELPADIALDAIPGDSGKHACGSASMAKAVIPSVIVRTSGRRSPARFKGAAEEAAMAVDPGADLQGSCGAALWPVRQCRGPVTCGAIHNGMEPITASTANSVDNNAMVRVRPGLLKSMHSRVPACGRRKTETSGCLRCRAVGGTGKRTARRAGPTHRTHSARRRENLPGRHRSIGHLVRRRRTPVAESDHRPPQCDGPKAMGGAA